MQSEELEQQRKRMTYQLALTGCDGIVLASDRCERTVSANQQFAARNMVRKITIDQTARFAWGCAGSEAALIFSRNVADAIRALGSDFSEEDALGALEEAAKLTAREYGPLSKGPWPCSTLFVCGPTKRIFSHPLTRAEERRNGRCIAGMEFNLASFLPCRLEDLPKLSVRELAYLAAYSVRAAHDLDTAFVDGLDIAVYRDSTHKFEFASGEAYWSEASKFDARILGLLREVAIPLPAAE